VKEQNRKISLYLMTQKGLSVLNHLIKKGKKHLIDKVIIGRDPNVKKDYSAEIAELCAGSGIKFFFRNQKYKIDTKYRIAVSWKWIIRTEKNTKLIVIHDSLLPKYRGFAPLVSALKNGEKKAGVTAIFARDSYDEGDIIHQLELEIKYPMKIKTLIGMISELYNDMADHLFDRIQKCSNLKGTPQNEKDATYSLWLDDEDYFIDWNGSSEEILRFINATGDPYKGAASFLKGGIVRILTAEKYPDKKIENRVPGKIIFKAGDHPVVVCGKGLLKLTSVTDDKYKSLLPLKELRIRFKRCENE